jgi:hypothetical protein
MDLVFASEDRLRQLLMGNETRRVLERGQLSHVHGPARTRPGLRLLLAAAGLGTHHLYLLRCEHRAPAPAPAVNVPTARYLSTLLACLGNFGSGQMGSARGGLAPIIIRTLPHVAQVSHRPMSAAGPDQTLLHSPRWSGTSV